jgi:hypothetical protein
MAACAMWQIILCLFLLSYGWSRVAEAQRPSASCALQPAEVLVGEAVTATVTASDFNPKHSVAYAWIGSGGQLTGSNRRTVYIDTTNLSPGGYTVTVRVSDAKARSNNEATCSASYAVKSVPPKNPPSMMCVSNPATLMGGEATTISCSCSSPDGVPYSVGNWTASSGSISGHGGSANLDTSGAQPGAIAVSATCTDQRGLTAQATTMVLVEYPPPPPQAAKITRCEFPYEKKPWRVDNTCKAMLDDVAKRLQVDPESKLVIVGNAEPSEKGKELAAERAVDCKAYLVTGEGGERIDATRIEVRTGSGGTKTAEFWIVPPGANFAPEGTGPVDENAVKPIRDASRHH